jgi:ectoine hydroxylase-related dioxygenase (phytanoyl-CoA dioxygenase family)
MSMRADPALLSSLKSEGVAVIPDVLPRDEALAMRPLLQRAIDEDLARWQGKPGYIDHWMVHNLMVRGLAFLRVLENRVLHAYLDEMLSDTCIVYAYTSSSMPPRGTNYSRRIHVDCPRVIPGYVTNVGITLALDDFTEENGATELLPNSQWRVDVPSEAEFDRDAIRFMPKAGQAVMFNARTWHRGGINRTNEPRHAITINACRSFMRQRFDYPRLVPPELLDQLGPLGRRFLGFNVRVPTSLEEYYVPEEQRLYKGGQG